MDQEFELPPMSGDNLPLKELKPERPGREKEGLEKHERGEKIVRPKPIILLVVLVVIILAVLAGVVIGFLIKGRKETVVLPSPSPTVASVSASLAPAGQNQLLPDKVNSFKQNLDKLDLKESLLSFPALDFKIRFEAEK